MTALNFAVGRHEAIVVADELLSSPSGPGGTTKVLPLPHMHALLACAGAKAVSLYAFAELVTGSRLDDTAATWAVRLPALLSRFWQESELDRNTTAVLIGVVDGRLCGWMFTAPTFNASPLRAGAPYTMPPLHAISEAAQEAAQATPAQSEPESAAAADERPEPPLPPWQTVRRYLVDVMREQAAEQRAPIGGKRTVWTITPDCVHVTWLPM